MSNPEDTAAGGGDPFARAAERLGDAGGEAWRPIKDPKGCPAKIVVQVLRVEERTVNTSNGPAATVVVTGSEQSGRVWDVWAWHTVLHRELAAAAPQPGDVIAIEYRGKVTPPGGGNAYESYKVARADTGSGSAFDWNTPRGGDDPEGGGIATRVVYEQAEQPQAAPQQPEGDIPF